MWKTGGVRKSRRFLIATSSSEPSVSLISQCAPLLVAEMRDRLTPFMLIDKHAEPLCADPSTRAISDVASRADCARSSMTCAGASCAKIESGLKCLCHTSVPAQVLRVACGHFAAAAASTVQWQLPAALERTLSLTVRTRLMIPIT